MKKSLFLLISVSLLCVLSSGATAQDIAAPDSSAQLITDTPAEQTGNGSDILCLPDAYQLDPVSCNPLGPSSYLTELAQKGISYPAAPFSGQTLDPALADIPYQYARLNMETNESAGLFNSPDDAYNNVNPVDNMPPGALRYVSYSDRADYDSAHFVKAKNDLWLRASPGGVNLSMLGRTFSATPQYRFGWVIETGQPYLEPDYNAALADVSYNREEILLFYDYVEAKETIWYQVGENEWFPRRFFHPAWVNTTAPQGVPGGRWIEVDLYEQILFVYDDYQLIYACLIASGMDPFFTQPGIFQIYEKKETEDMTGSFESDRSDFYYLEDVPWTMYFDQARAFHGAYWRAWYGYTQSHGCINMSIGDAHWLFDWAQIGDYVYIHDPSGETPTDPAYYGAGGA